MDDNVINNYEEPRLKCILLKKSKDNPRVIYSNHMIINSIIASLSNDTVIGETDFVNYFCYGEVNGGKKLFEEKKHNTVKNIYHCAYATKKPKLLIDMMNFVNETKKTKLSLETVGVKMNKELSDDELNKINDRITKIQFNDQRKQIHEKIKEFIEKELISKRFGTVGEEYFYFKFGICQEYANGYLEDYRKMTLAKAIENLINIEEFYQKYYKKELDNKAINKLLYNLAIFYSYEIIKE